MSKKKVMKTYTETKKFSNTLQISIFITEIHDEINTDFFFTVNAIVILFNAKYFMHRCKISFYGAQFLL